MENLDRAAVILTLAKELRDHGSWCGSTHLQKTTYFLQELTGAQLDFEFILYKHGPFSFDLRDNITGLVAYNLLRMQPNEPPYGASLELTSRGERVMSGHAELANQYQREIAFVAQHLANKKVTDLEKLGTALFVTHRQPGLDRNAQAHQIHSLKPHVSLEEAHAALEELHTMEQEWQRSL
jgi:hypothetical protein